MDWMIFWTAILAASAVVTLVSGLFAVLRKLDWKVIRGIKDDMDRRTSELTDRMDVVYTTMQAKLDKQEHQLALARIDKEMEQLRRDQKEDFKRIEDKIDKLSDTIIAVIKERR